MEHLVQTLLLLGRAHHEALEGVLFGSSFDFFVSDALSQLCLVTLPLKLFPKIELSADKDAWAGACTGLDLRDPLLAGVLEGVSLHETEANDEAVRVSVGNGTQATQVLVARSVPNLKLDLAALVVLCSIVCVEYRRLVQRWEGFLGPSHNDGGFTDGCVADEDELHVVLLVLVHQGLICVHNLYHLC